MKKNTKGLKVGNPGNRGGGRRKDKVIKRVKEIASEYTEESVKRLVYWMRSDNPKASVQATLALIERIDGKAPQSLDVTVKKTPEEIEAENKRYERLYLYLDNIAVKT